MAKKTAKKKTAKATEKAAPKKKRHWGGGRREGAGRKPLDPEAGNKVPVSFKLHASIIEYLEANKKNASKNATVEAAIMRSKGYRDWKAAQK